MPKSTYMYWQKNFKRPNKDKTVEEEIRNIFKENNENYGYRRITAELRRRDYLINEKKVRRIMKKLDLVCKSFTRKSRRYNSYRGTVGKVAKNKINRRFKTNISHQKMTTDTTEFKYYIIENNRTTIKKLYLDPFLDMYNGEVLSYSVSERPNAKAINNALKKAIQVTNDCLYRRTFHSDQGWAYQMKKYQNTLEKERIFQSMSRKGTCLDNSPIENFFGVMKQEMYYGKTYRSFEELKLRKDEYIYYYNNKRIKSKLGYMSPVQFRFIK
jgi:putative transposase